MIGYLVDVEFVWGFQSKVVGYSKTSPSFHYPPPTSFLGAIAASIAREKSIGEGRGRDIISMLSNNLLALSMRPLNCSSIKFSDVIRLIAIRKTGEELYPSRQDPRGSFDAPASGKTILVPLDGEPPRLRYCTVFRNNILGQLRNKELTVDSDVMWQIHRLGSKESIVSVTDVREFKPALMTQDVTTTYSFPLIGGVEPKNYESPKWVQEQLINPFTVQTYDPVTHYLLGQNVIKYFLPIIDAPENPPRYRVFVTENARAYSFGEEVAIGIWRTK